MLEEASPLREMVTPVDGVRSYYCVKPASGWLQNNNRFAVGLLRWCNAVAVRPRSWMERRCVPGGPIGWLEAAERAVPVLTHPTHPTQS